MKHEESPPRKGNPFLVFDFQGLGFGFWGLVLLQLKPKTINYKPKTINQINHSLRQYYLHQVRRVLSQQIESWLSKMKVSLDSLIHSTTHSICTPWLEVLQRAKQKIDSFCS